MAWPTQCRETESCSGQSRETNVHDKYDQCSEQSLGSGISAAAECLEGRGNQGMCERPGVGFFRSKLKSRVDKRHKTHLRAPGTLAGRAGLG